MDRLRGGSFLAKVKLKFLGRGGEIGKEGREKRSKIKRIIACSQMCASRMTWESQSCPPSIIAICF